MPCFPSFYSRMSAVASRGATDVPNSGILSLLKRVLSGLCRPTPAPVDLASQEATQWRERYVSLALATIPHDGRLGGDTSRFDHHSIFDHLLVCLSSPHATVVADARAIITRGLESHQLVPDERSLTHLGLWLQSDHVVVRDEAQLIIRKWLDSHQLVPDERSLTNLQFWLQSDHAVVRDEAQLIIRKWLDSHQLVPDERSLMHLELWLQSDHAVPKGQARLIIEDWLSNKKLLPNQQTISRMVEWSKKPHCELGWAVAHTLAWWRNDGDFKDLLLDIDPFRSSPHWQVLDQVNQLKRVSKP